MQLMHGAHVPQYTQTDQMMMVCAMEKKTHTLWILILLDTIQHHFSWLPEFALFVHANKADCSSLLKFAKLWNFSFRGWKIAKCWAQIKKLFRKIDCPTSLHAKSWRKSQNRKKVLHYIKNSIRCVQERMPSAKIDKHSEEKWRLKAIFPL